MSRGLGRVERQILELLTPRRKGRVPRMGARELAGWLAGFDQPVPAAARVSVYQALASLERKGLVVRRHRDGHQGDTWCLAEAQRREADRQRKEEARQRRRQSRGNGAEPKPSRAPITRLVQLLGMLGSDHDGEALNAARAVEAERRRLGATWPELISPILLLRTTTL